MSAKLFDFLRLLNYYNETIVYPRLIEKVGDILLYHKLPVRMAIYRVSLTIKMNLTMEKIKYVITLYG